MNNSSDLLEHDRFFIFGAARSGLAAARLLVALGKKVALYDEAPPGKLLEARREARDIGLEVHSKLDELGFPNGWEVLVLSPGIPATHPLVVLAGECGCIVRSEIEVAFQACPAPVVAITGTNGKTTVTHLVTHFFHNAGRPVVMGGNVGRPLSDAVLETRLESPEAVVVCEVSSFQLETIEHFAPETACVLNVTPDHLDRYGTMANYIEAKYQITENQNEEQTLVVNGDDRYCLSFLARTQARGWLFSLQGPVPRGTFLEGDTLYLSHDDAAPALPVMERSEIPLPGLHNVANVLAALSIGAAMRLDHRQMARAVASFQAVPHRIELVAEIQGVRYYNDSKATNLDSMEKALNSFDEAAEAKAGVAEPPPGKARPRIVLIAGGRDKGDSWTRLSRLVADKVKALVLIGEATPLARKAWGDVVASTLEAADMSEAVSRARETAEPGDIVLLSPGCASFDMYRNFEERGDCFRSVVREIESLQTPAAKSP